MILRGSTAIFRQFYWFCLGNEAGAFLNSSFKLEPAAPVLHWESKFLHISCARGRSVGKNKVGIMFVAMMSEQPTQKQSLECWGTPRESVLAIKAFH